MVNKYSPPPSALGPDTISFDYHGGGPYVRVSNGCILIWQGRNWSGFDISSANRNKVLCNGTTNPNLESICGRPLGMKFNPTTCDLYAADAYFGLLMVGHNGGVARNLITSVEDVAFRLTNALEIDEQI
ncbi:hypothetical protein ACFE04_010861 [Oxalis oulophora]